MSLICWIPLTSNTLNNQGIKNMSVTNNSATYSSSGGKLSAGCWSFSDGTKNGYGININKNFTDIGSNRSICAWVYPKGNHADYAGAIVSSGNWNSSRWSFGVERTNGGFTGFDSGYSSYYSTSIPLNTWTHLCVTVADGVTKFYKNGIYLGEQSRGSGTINSDASNTMIGRETYANGYFGFNGSIQDVRIYDHCLSAQEVKEISKGLVLHYPLDSISIFGKNLIDGYFVSGSINNGTVTFENGVATINNTSGSWCRTICRNEDISNTNLANVSISGKQITLSFDIYMISGNIPTIFISDSYRAVTGVVASKTEVWQRAYVTYTHPGQSSSYGYFCPHFSSVGNYKVRNLKLTIGGIKDYYSEYNQDGIVYDISGYHNNGLLSGTLSTINSPRYNNCFTGSATITCNNLNFPDGPTTLSFWSKPEDTATSGTTSNMGISYNKCYYFTYFNYPYFRRTGTNNYKYKYNNYWSDNKWHHVCATYDGNSVVKLYIDGEDCSPSTSTEESSATVSFVISLTKYAVSDVRLYATALSSSDIQYLYSLGN